MGEGELNAELPVESGEVRHTGITTIGDVPWGTHFCQFYQDKQDLIDILVPFFKAGLKNNEFCMWVTSEPLRAAEAKAALAANIENLERYIANGQLEILDTEWYTFGEKFESDRVLQSWVDRLEAATRRGFDGLRLTGNTFWLEKPEWHGFMEYEATVDTIFEQNRILAICTYSLSRCGALQIMDVISNHAFALVKRAGKWEVIQSAERKKVEANLRESEERLRFAQDTANIGTFDWDIATGKNTWTTKLETMYGLPPGGFLGTQPAWEALVHSEDRPRVLERVSESLETGAPMEEDEWRVIWPDGSVHWLAGRWRVVKNAGGQPVRVMGVNIDVTDRKQMEEELRKSEERFRLGIKATNDAIWDMDLKTGSVSWNETYSALYGSPSAGSDSWEWWIENIHPEDRERTAGCLGKAIASGASSWTSEYRFRRVDGEWAHIYDRAYIARDASGNAWRVIGAMQDLTERKQAETTLRESEERFRRVFEEGPLGLALVGRDYRFLKVNGALCQMVGYSEAELVQTAFTDITHPEDIRADVELAEQLFKREIPFYRIEKRYMKKTGEIIWVRLLWNDAPGRVEAVLVLFNVKFPVGVEVS
jgi:PAS domain S-box-containing protein